MSEEYTTISNSRQIILLGGQVALVDDADFAHLSQFRWFMSDNRPFCRIKRKMVQMSCEIMKPETGFIVDHKNGNGLDCRRDNLRVCTHSQNMKNRKKHRRNGGEASSKYKGVSKSGKKWRASITCDRVIYRLGMFFCEE